MNRDFKSKFKLLKIKNFTAFTLVELILVVSLLAAVSVGAFSVLSNGLKIWQRVELSSDTENAHIFLQRLSNDLNNWAGIKTVDPVTGAHILQYPFLNQFGTLPDESLTGANTALNILSYKYNPSRRKVLRTVRNYREYFSENEGKTQEVLNNVENFSFEYYTKNQEGMLEKRPEKSSKLIPNVIQINLTYQDQAGNFHAINDYIDVKISG